MEIKHFMGNSWFRHENPPAEEEEENWSPRKAFLSELFMAKVRFLSPQDFIIYVCFCGGEFDTDVVHSHLMK